MGFVLVFMVNSHYDLGGCGCGGDDVVVGDCYGWFYDYTAIFSGFVLEFSFLELKY